MIVDGVSTTAYVLRPDWASASSDASTVMFDYNNRMYLSKTEAIDPTQYHTFDLLPGYLSFEVDLSTVECNCLTALYTVTMPAVDNTWDPFMYCDASDVGGYFCPEFDIMEANMHAFRTTAHECDAPVNGAYPSCHGDGNCVIDFILDAEASSYGSGTTYGINTALPFKVRIGFNADENGLFSGYEISLIQERNRVIMASDTCSSYLNSLTDAMH